MKRNNKKSQSKNFYTKTQDKILRQVLRYENKKNWFFWMALI